MTITAYFEAKITELQAHLDLKRDAFQTAQEPANRAKIQHEIYFLLGQQKAYYTAPLQEDELVYCEDCLVTISAGGTAHTMTEQFRKQQKNNGAKNKEPKSDDDLYL
jgi:hypothetical protein